MIVIKTSKGDVCVRLDEEHAPQTVANFLHYVRDGFYDETLFHRVIPGFMIQGGGFTESMESKPVITNNPHSATSQFFINLVDNAFLNYRGDHAEGHGYCVFGEVVDGMDVVDAIAGVKTGQRKEHGDVPLEDVMIHSMQEVD